MSIGLVRCGVISAIRGKVKRVVAIYAAVEPVCALFVLVQLDVPWAIATAPAAAVQAIHVDAALLNAQGKHDVAAWERVNSVGGVVMDQFIGMPKVRLVVSGRSAEFVAGYHRRIRPEADARHPYGAAGGLRAA